MSDTIKPELAKENPFWIERHRYYELKHFCLQYPVWKQAFISFDGLSKSYIDHLKVMGYAMGNPVERCAAARELYAERIWMVEKCAQETDAVLCNYILIGVTRGMKYEYLRAMMNIPCGRSEYYKLYREFFWRLDKVRA